MLTFREETFYAVSFSINLEARHYGMSSVPASETDIWSKPVSSLLHRACSHQAVLRPGVISCMFSVPTSEADRWSKVNRCPACSTLPVVIRPY